MEKTGWSEIICDSALVFIDDERLIEKLKNNPARFFREMSLYMKLAIPRFNRPPEVIAHLADQTPPQFGDYLWKSEGSGGAATIETGMTGYELCNVSLQGTDRYRNPIETPVAAEYNSETGAVTIPGPIGAGAEYDMDFYTDGYFLRPISGEMKRILGLCVQAVWENRFSSAWLPRASKVTDKSFVAPNEANWTRAQEEKRRSAEATLNEELRQYEQNRNYMNTVGGVKRTLL